MKQLIATGACYLDTILTYPEEDSKLRATNLVVRRGGNCPNSLEVLQQLTTSLSLYVVSPLPRRESIASNRILSSFGTDSRIDLSRCLFREEYEEAASSYIIRSEATGTRTLVNYNALPEMTADEFSRTVIDTISEDEEAWWHFEGRIPDVTAECVRAIKRKHPRATVSVEIEKPGREGLIELANEADVVFYSRTWAESRGYASAEECLRGEKTTKATKSFCPWGADGAGALTHATNTFVFVPVSTPADKITVVDAVGAGDTFIAGILYALADRGWDVPHAVQFAVDLATLKVQQEGFSGLGEKVKDRL